VDELGGSCHRTTWAPQLAKLAWPRGNVVASETVFTGPSWQSKASNQHVKVKLSVSALAWPVRPAQTYHIKPSHQDAFAKQTFPRQR